MSTEKGTPRGSIQPFPKDLICLLQRCFDVYNYADDYTIRDAGKDQEQVCMSLTKSSEVMIRWFNNNFMQAKPKKIQLILFGTSSSLQTGSNYCKVTWYIP